jgi:hypothetical protein
VKDYWSQEFVCSVPFSDEIFTQNHFFRKGLFWMLHLETVSDIDCSLRTVTQEVNNCLKYADARC